MSIRSPYPFCEFEATNILDYAFPAGEELSDEPLWIDSLDPTKSLSPRQALQWAKRTCFGLERLGLRRGDVVMIFTVNHIFVPPAYYGIVGGGYVFSAANPAYTVNELVHQMRNLEPKLLLVQPMFLETALHAASQAGIPKDRIFQFSDEPKHVPIKNGIADWRTMLGTSAGGKNYRWPRFSPEESRTTIATVNFSSGTTGLPKGVCITHANIIANVEQTIFMRYAETATPYDIERKSQQGKPPPFQPPTERYVGILPLYHAFGQSWILFIALRLQHPVYIMPTFHYEHFLEVVAKYKVTMLQVPPPVLTMMCKRPETSKFDLSSLQKMVVGAAPLSRELQIEIQRRFQVHVIQGWGMTEVTCGGIFVPGGIKDERGSIGMLLPGTEARIVGEDGAVVVRKQGEKGRGQRGELLVKGPQICLGYWRNEGATKETLSEDGWLQTGDVVEVDEKGWFWIVDRKKELIKVNAFQVAPAELELLLLENEHVSDAAVVGIRIDDNEWPRAYCSIQPSSKGKVAPEDIQGWVKSRVAKHKQLVGGVVFIDEVPRLQSGKIQRKVMREWAKRDAEEMKKAGAVLRRARI